jgi:Rieske 2Fe-2S family protein
MRLVPPLALPRAAVDLVLAPLDRAVPFPAAAYLDDAVFAFERAAIFGRAWLPVAREDEVALPGQWILASVAGDEIVVVRGADLEVRAFYNICRHRGTPLVDGACGRAAHLECPYHAWTYELDGRIRDAPHAPAPRAGTTYDLIAARAAVWQGFVFVCADATAPSLEDWLGVVPPWLEGGALGSIRRAHRATYEVQANWKLLAENFQESHHFPRVHPALERLTPTARASSWGEGGPWLGGIMDLMPDAETVSLSRTRSDRPLLVAEEDARRVHDALLFPGFFSSLQPDYLLTYRLVPLAAARTRVVAETFFHAAAFRAGFDPDDVLALWSRVNDEDRAICERQQRGLGSSAYAPSHYAEVEDGVHAFDRLVARAHREGR